jgi:hypothetical protein
MTKSKEHTTQKNSGVLEKDKDKQWYKPLHRKLKIEQHMPHAAEFRCSERVNNAWSTCSTRRVTRDTNSVISHEWWKDRIAITTNGT